MTDNLIDFAAAREARQPYNEGPARCLGCDHTWHAVAPVGLVTFECPACHRYQGAFVGLIFPPEDQQLWVCGCGGQFFVLTTRAPQCVLCGTLARCWEPIE